ncbi:hypothetical protein BDV93DRAFT_564504 [Ceratobasidium sp. AG-I]|nr:hypothetical protein BDV93DRAFT_564504 [Ceratobasidium sp. AG-I]
MAVAVGAGAKSPSALSASCKTTVVSVLTGLASTCLDIYILMSIATTLEN